MVNILKYSGYLFAWAVTAFFLVIVISLIVFVPLADQLPHTFDAHYEESFPVWYLSIFFGVPALLAPPLLLSKVVSTSIGDQYNECISVKVVFVGTLICVIFALFGIFNVTSLFIYFLLIALLTHKAAYKHKKTIHVNFYKKLEYVYIAIAVGGMLSVVTYVSDVRGIEIVELENRINNAKNAAAMDEQDQKEYGWLTACVASESPAWCYDFMELDKLENQLESLKKSNSVKLSPEYKLMGYVLLAFALATKLLKISGELFKWYNIDDETHRVEDDVKVSRFIMANHIKKHKTKKSRYNKHNKT